MTMLPYTKTSLKRKNWRKEEGRRWEGEGRKKGRGKVQTDLFFLFSSWVGVGEGAVPPWRLQRLHEGDVNSVALDMSVRLYIVNTQ